MIICVQMVPVSLLVLYAYSTKPYEINSARLVSTQEHENIDSDDNEEMISGLKKRYQGGPWGLYAWAAYLNPLELIRDVMSAHAMIHKARAAQKAHIKVQAQEMDRYQTRYDSGTGA